METIPTYFEFFAQTPDQLLELQNKHDYVEISGNAFVDSEDTVHVYGDFEISENALEVCVLTMDVHTERDCTIQYTDTKKHNLHINVTGTNTLHMIAPTLDCLNIISTSIDTPWKRIQIDAPNLRFLTLLGTFEYETFEISTNCPILNRAEIFDAVITETSNAFIEKMIASLQLGINLNFEQEEGEQ